jgi:hypothetical protein
MAGKMMQWKTMLSLPMKCTSRASFDFQYFSQPFASPRWLTEQVFEARMMALTATVTGENNAAATQIVPHLTDYGLYLLRWEVIAFVLTTNSGANYWTMRLRGAGATTLASTDSSAQAPGVAWRATITSFSNHAAYDYYNVRTEITAGAPGSLTWRWAARYRLIIT